MYATPLLPNPVYAFISCTVYANISPLSITAHLPILVECTNPIIFPQRVHHGLLHLAGRGGLTVWRSITAHLCYRTHGLVFSQWQSQAQHPTKAAHSRLLQQACRGDISEEHVGVFLFHEFGRNANPICLCLWALR